MADVIPVSGVLVREGEMTGDGRIFKRGAIRWDSDVLPIPIIFDREEGDHSGATIGYIDTVWRDGTDIMGSGVLSASDDPEAQAAIARAAELLDEGAVGVSIGADATRGDLRISTEVFDNIVDEGNAIRIPIAYDDAVLSFSEARLRHLAIVDTPAFATASISKVSGAIVASAGIDQSHYFNDPGFGVPGTDDRLRYDPGNDKWSCPVTVQGNHIFGHIAPTGICLRGQPGRCINPPDGDLEGFMRQFAPAAGGKRTGCITLGGHSPTGIGAVEATKHYDKMAVADVRVGRDAYGYWFSGMIRPGTSDEDRYALAASDVSGHWEPDAKGRATLVGLPAVSVGGFPKGYLTHDEVMSGIAAAGSILPDGDEFWDDGSAHLDIMEVELVEIEAHGVDCGCAQAGAIPLETILAFHDLDT